MRLLIAVLALLIATPALADEPVPSKVETYKVVLGDPLTARVFLPASPAKPAPAMLLFHGGGWAVGDATWTDPAAKRFADRGIVGISIDYRLAAKGVTPIDAFDDACAAFAWARLNAKRLGIDPKRIGGFGVSAGGHLMAVSATKGCPAGKGVWRPALVVLRSPALSIAHDDYFTRLLAGRGKAADWSPLNLGPSRAPTLIIQGDADTLTPLSAAAAFCEATVKANGVCEVNIYERVGHLLTRNLKDQEDNYDPDPTAVRESWAYTFTFLQRQGWVN